VIDDRSDLSRVGNCSHGSHIGNTNRQMIRSIRRILF
jgi:hypothetical protein